jgi:tight adherence protein B
VVTAAAIQREVGGGLADLFDMVAETVRNRQQFRRKVRGLTAMGRLSAYILIALPFVVAVVITALNSEYMAPLYDTSAGTTLIVIGLSLMAVGSVLLRKIVSFRG